VETVITGHPVWALNDARISGFVRGRVLVCEKAPFKGIEYTLAFQLFDLIGDPVIIEIPLNVQFPCSRTF